MVVTDGEDNASSANAGAGDPPDSGFGWAGDLLRGAAVLGDDTDKRESRHAKRVLEQISEQTGGVAYFPKSLKEVDGIAAQVAEDIRTQYSIAYRSTNPPSKGRIPAGACGG